MLSFVLAAGLLFTAIKTKTWWDNHRSLFHSVAFQDLELPWGGEDLRIVGSRLVGTNYIEPDTGRVGRVVRCKRHTIVVRFPTMTT